MKSLLAKTDHVFHCASQVMLCLSNHQNIKNSIQLTNTTKQKHNIKNISFNPVNSLYILFSHFLNAYNWVW